MNIFIYEYIFYLYIGKEILALLEKGLSTHTYLICMSVMLHQHNVTQTPLPFHDLSYQMELDVINFSLFSLIRLIFISNKTLFSLFIIACKYIYMQILCVHILHNMCLRRRRPEPAFCLGGWWSEVIVGSNGGTWGCSIWLGMTVAKINSRKTNSCYILRSSTFWWFGMDVASSF